MFFASTLILPLLLVSLSVNTVLAKENICTRSTVTKKLVSPSSAHCPIHDNETVHMVMDRICEMCHEFSSHSRPNMRAECRAECFGTDTFRTCLQLFTPRRHTRHSHRY